MTTTISTSSDVVEITKLLTEAITKLAWPMVVLVLLVSLRRYIPALINRTTGFAWGNLKVEFERRLERAEDAAAKVPPSGADQDAEVQPEADTTSTDLPPGFIVLEAWRLIERELLQLAERTGISLIRGRSPLYLLRMLRSREIIDSSTALLLDELRHTRNTVVHGSDEEAVSLSQALRFRDLAAIVVAKLRSIPPGGLND